MNDLRSIRTIHYFSRIIITTATRTHAAVEVERHALVGLAEALLELHELRGRDLVQGADPVAPLVGHVAVRVRAGRAEVGVAVEAVVAGVGHKAARLAHVAQPLALQLNHRIAKTANRSNVNSIYIYIVHVVCVRNTKRAWH